VSQYVVEEQLECLEQPLELPLEPPARWQRPPLQRHCPPENVSDPAQVYWTPLM